MKRTLTNISAPSPLTHEEQSSFRIGIIVSQFNNAIVEELLTACQDSLQALNLPLDSRTIVSVPGALEIPFAADMMLNKQPSPHFSCLIALGCVIRGDTYHFEIVCNESASNLQTLQLTYHTPIINGIMTTETTEQAQQRLPLKGIEAAHAAIKMARLQHHYLIHYL